MGSMLCCMKNSSHSEQIQEDEEVIEKPSFGEDGEGQISIKRNSTLKECLLASPNLNPQHFVNGNELQVFTQLHQKAYPPSSRIHHVLSSPQTPEWKGSPSPQAQCMLNSPQTPQWREPSLLNQQFLTSPEIRTEFFTPRKSFSSDEVGKLGKVDEKDDEKDEAYFTSLMRRNGSGKMKKKVSFRLPEASDVYIFYSPMENFEEK